MGNIFNQDFLDFIESLNQNEVAYLLVGGYAVNIYGYRRSTGDLDIWVNPTEDNYHHLIKAFNHFGLPKDAIKLEDFLGLSSQNYDVFTFGVSPVAIDILTQCKGLQFTEAYNRSEVMDVEGINIRLIHLKDLINAKKAVGRNRDIDDIQHLTK